MTSLPSQVWQSVRSLFRRRIPSWLGGKRDPLGQEGEDAAVKLLRSGGYQILGRNVRTPAGEADILAQDPDRTTIVLVEVKARRVREGSALPPPEKSVHAAKRRRLIKIGKHLARANQWNDRGVRVDVIAVEWRQDQAPELRHHRGVLWVQRTPRSIG